MPGRSSWKPSRSAFAGPTSRSWRASTAGPLRARRASCSGTNRSAAWWIRARAGGLKKGDLVVGIVRRPDPVPCPNCAVGEWDMCRNGQYTERGIKEIDGLHVRALADRARVRDEGRPLARAPRRAARAHDSRHQGVGAGRRGRPACLLGAADRARDRCRTDRSSCRPRRQSSTGSRSTSSTGSNRGPSRSSFAPWGRPTTPAPSRASASSRT